MFHREAVVLRRNVRLQQQKTLVPAEYRRVFHPVPEVVVRNVSPDGRRGQLETVGQMSHGIFPAQRVVGRRKADRVGVAASEARKCQFVTRGDLPLGLQVCVPDTQFQRRHPSVPVQAFFQQAVFQAERGPAARYQDRGLVFYEGCAHGGAEKRIGNGGSGIQRPVIEGR